MTSDIDASAAVVAEKAPGFKPKVGLILGSGLGPFAESVEEVAAISYADLPGFPEPGVAGHAGRLLLGTVGGTPVAVMQGRAHFYETGTADAMKTPVRTLKALGCEALVVTNAAGSTDTAAGPGSVMMLTDHISFTGASPLFGEEGDRRFVDLSAAYDGDFQVQLRKAAAANGITLAEGVYMWFCGPHFETPAEIRAAKVLGATAVGMSTVPEVILARHAGLRVAALSIITNLAAGMSDVALSHDQTMKMAAVAAGDVQTLLTAFLSDFS
jgi:purine-nucleoside phosphorylase